MAFFFIHMRAHARACKRCVFYWLHSLHPLFMGILSGYKSRYTTGYIFLNWLHLIWLLPNRFWLLWAKNCPAEQGFCPNQREEKKSPSGFLSGEILPKGRSRSPEALLKGKLSHKYNYKRISKFQGKVVKITIYISGDNKAVSRGASLLPLIFACLLYIWLCMLPTHHQQATLQSQQAHYILRLHYLFHLYSLYISYKDRC